MGELLRRHHPERQTGVDEFGRQTLGGNDASLENRLEPDLSGVADAFVELGERVAVVEIRGVDDVPGGAEFIGERETPRRQSLRMMEQQQLSGAYSVA